MRAIITGAAGFIGSHVAEVLLQAGHQVLGIDDMTGAYKENIVRGMEFEQRGCTEPLDKLFQEFRPHAVYHLAAYAAEGLSHHIPVFNFENNVVATANVLGASFRNGAKHFVFTSSIAAYGHPDGATVFEETTNCQPCDPYGIAKLACEYHIKAFYDYFGAPAYTIFRPHNVFGPRQNISDPYRNVVGIFMRCALEGNPLPIFGDGTQTRSFSFIDTVARCIAESPLNRAAHNQVFNVGSDAPMSVRELASEISKLLSVPLKVEHLPARKEVAHAHCSHEKVREAFPHIFVNEVDLVDGLRIMADYVKSHAVPRATDCPSPIEISDQLPPSWMKKVAKRTC